MEKKNETPNRDQCHKGINADTKKIDTASDFLKRALWPRPWNNIKVVYWE